MYGVSIELPFASFIGEECNLIGLGRFQIQFHFSGSRKSISGESKWEVRDPEGRIVDQWMPDKERTQYRVHHLIDQLVRGFAVDAIVIHI